MIKTIRKISDGEVTTLFQRKDTEDDVIAIRRSRKIQIGNGWVKAPYLWKTEKIVLK